MSQSHAIQRNVAFRNEQAPARKAEPGIEKPQTAKQRADTFDIGGDTDDILRQARAMRAEWRKNRYARLLNG